MKKLFLAILFMFLLFTLIKGFRGVVRRVEHGRYTDGTYEQSTVPDEEGWSKSVEIEISDGKIVNVSYDEFNPETGSKAEDDDYINKWRTATSMQADPKQVYRALAMELVRKQDPKKVDDITGASISSKVFRGLAIEVLRQAKR